MKLTSFEVGPFVDAAFQYFGVVDEVVVNTARGLTQHFLGWMLSMGATSHGWEAKRSQSLPRI